MVQTHVAVDVVWEAELLSHRDHSLDFVGGAISNDQVETNRQARLHRGGQALVEGVE